MNRVKKIFIPSAGPEDWKKLLAQESHWKEGCSAQLLANAWETAVDEFPIEISSTLEQIPEFKGIKPLFMFPEWKVPLKGRGRSSQNDLWILAKCEIGLVSITIEGKAEESFGETVRKWNEDNNENKLTRIKYLLEILGIADGDCLHDIHYQLVHRAASAVIEAERFGATQAAMIVHSFSSADRHISDFEKFTKIFNQCKNTEKTTTVIARNNIPLHLAWVHGEKRKWALRRSSSGE